MPQPADRVDRSTHGRSEPVSSLIARSGRASVSLLLSCAIVANSGCSGNSPLRGALNSTGSGGEVATRQATADSSAARGAPAAAIDREIANTESSADDSRNYAPVIQPQARVGEYRVFAHFFGSNRNRASARTRVLATVVRRWGSANEEVTTRAITLGDTGDRQNIELVRWSQ
jgi:hypothetical protein